MNKHLKRERSPKEWPISRKGTTFLVNAFSKKGVPLVVILRDFLKLAETRKEIKRAVNNKWILLNRKAISNERLGVSLFDTFSILPSKKNYRLGISNKGKFSLQEISEEESKKKVVKIENKRILNDKKIQLNLSDGENILSNQKCNVGDSVIINLENKKIEKILPLETNKKLMIFSGKHAGETGKIKEIKKEKRMVIVDKGTENLNILIKKIIVIE